MLNEKTRLMVVVQFVSTPIFCELLFSINLWKSYWKSFLWNLKQIETFTPILNLLDCSLSW